MPLPLALPPIAYHSGSQPVGCDPLGSHIRDAAYQMFTLQFITVAKWLLWSSNKIIL